MIFPDIYEPTKVNFEVRNIEPASRHYFDDGFEVRVAKTAFTEIAVNIVVEGATDWEAKVLMDFYGSVRGTTDPFSLDIRGVNFRNHPEFANWVETMYTDPDRGYLIGVKWYFEGKPKVEVVAVGTYNLDFTLKSWRRLFPNYRISTQYLG